MPGPVTVCNPTAQAIAVQQLTEEIERNTVFWPPTLTLTLTLTLALTLSLTLTLTLTPNP